MRSADERIGWVLRRLEREVKVAPDGPTTRRFSVLSESELPRVWMYSAQPDEQGGGIFALRRCSRVFLLSLCVFSFSFRQKQVMKIKFIEMGRV